MSTKTVLVLCAQALLAQCVFSQYISRAAVEAPGLGPLGWAGPAFGPALPCDGLAASLGFNRIPHLADRWAYDGYPAAASALDFTPTSGGGFVVSSGSAVPPTGISIVSDNAFEGHLEVVGELPFVGTTVMDGMVPSTGSGAINHGCGNGVNAMTGLSELSTPASVATASILDAPVLAAAPLAAPLAYDGLAYGAGYDGLVYASPLEGLEITPTSGGALPVSSASAIPPTGIAVNSETAYEGPLAVAGELPFVGTVGVEGVLPTAGAGAVNHACGNGVNAMVSENTAFAPGFAASRFGNVAGLTPAAGFAPGIGANRWAGRGFGCAY